jgi:CRP-like cAMP-binding protein
MAGSAPDSILARFEGEAGQRRLRDVLKAQPLLCCDEDAIREVADGLRFRELVTGDLLIQQEETDTDLFLILSGRVRIFVNGREVAERSTGQHVGEMAIVDPNITQNVDGDRGNDDAGSWRGRRPLPQDRRPQPAHLAGGRRRALPQARSTAQVPR